ncbi:uncharacterized protein LOC144599125 isoform X3 [Rhinoraja longicauda]
MNCAKDFVNIGSLDSAVLLIGVIGRGKRYRTWRSKLTTGACAAENRRTAEAQKKRTLRKARATSTSTAAAIHLCPTCGHAFPARIGRTSRFWTHSHQSSN